MAEELLAALNALLGILTDKYHVEKVYEPHDELIINRESLGASASVQSPYKIVTDALLMNVSVQVTYNGSATTAVTVYGYAVHEKKRIDTDELWSFSTSITAGSTIKKTAIVDAIMSEIMIKVTNGDSSYACTMVKVWITTMRERLRLRKVS